LTHTKKWLAKEEKLDKKLYGREAELQNRANYLVPMIIIRFFFVVGAASKLAGVLVTNIFSGK